MLVHSKNLREVAANTFSIVPLRENNGYLHYDFTERVSNVAMWDRKIPALNLNMLYAIIYGNGNTVIIPDIPHKKLEYIMIDDQEPFTTNLNSLLTRAQCILAVLNTSTKAILFFQTLNSMGEMQYIQANMNNKTFLVIPYNALPLVSFQPSTMSSGDILSLFGEPLYQINNNVSLHIYTCIGNEKNKNASHIHDRYSHAFILFFIENDKVISTSIYLKEYKE